MSLSTCLCMLRINLYLISFPFESLFWKFFGFVFLGCFFFFEVVPKHYKPALISLVKMINKTQI